MAAEKEAQQIFCLTDSSLHRFDLSGRGVNQLLGLSNVESRCCAFVSPQLHNS